MKKNYFGSNNIFHKMILVMVLVFCFFAVPAGAAEKRATTVNSDDVIESNMSHGKWAYNSGKGHPVCDDLLKRLNSYSWNCDKDERNQCARRIALSYPKFKEVPWQNLDPKAHEDLIFKMLRNSSCGAVSGVVDEKPRNCHDKLIRDDARKFIAEGGRLQIWSTDLLSKYLDSSSNSRMQTIARIIRKRSVDDLVNSDCPVEKTAEWAHSMSFIVKDDLSDLDSNLRYYRQHIPMNSHIRFGKAFFYSGKLYFVSNHGDGITGTYFNKDKPTTFCSISYKESKRRR